MVDRPGWKQAAVRGAQPHGVNHEATVLKSQAHDFKQDAGLIGADRQHALRVVLGVQTDCHKRVAKRMFDGSAFDAMLVGRWVD